MFKYGHRRRQRSLIASKPDPQSQNRKISINIGTEKCVIKRMQSLLVANIFFSLKFNIYQISRYHWYHWVHYKHERHEEKLTETKRKKKKKYRLEKQNTFATLMKLLFFFFCIIQVMCLLSFIRRVFRFICISIDITRNLWIAIDRIALAVWYAGQTIDRNAIQKNIPAMAQTSKILVSCIPNTRIKSNLNDVFTSCH